MYSYSMSTNVVFNETCKTLKIFENSGHRKIKTSSLKSDGNSSLFVVENNVESSGSVFIGSQSEFTSDVEKKIAVHHPSYLQLQETIRENEAIIEMYKRFLEKLKDFQDQKRPSYIMDYFADIICPSNITKTIKEMKSVVSHIRTVAAEGAKLKQVLRSNVLNDVWKIKKEYHKTVINFFKMASDLVKDTEVLIISLQNKKEYKPERLKILQEKERKFLAVLHEYMDFLSEFHNFVQKYSTNVTH